MKNPAEGFFDDIGKALTFGFDLDMCLPACLILCFGFPAELLVRIFWLNGSLDIEYLLYFSCFPFTFYHFFMYGWKLVKDGPGGAVVDDFMLYYMHIICIFIHILINYACSRGSTAGKLIVTPFLIIFMIITVALARVYRKLNSCPLVDESGKPKEQNLNFSYPIEQALKTVGLGYCMYSIISAFCFIWARIGPKLIPIFIPILWMILPITFLITNLVLTGLSFLWNGLTYIPGMDLGLTYFFYLTYLNMWENSNVSNFNKFCNKEGELLTFKSIGLFAFALICALAMGLVRNRLIKAAIGIIAFIAVTIFDNIDLKTGKPKEGGALDISNPLNPN